MNLEELKVVDADVAAAIEAEMDRQNSHIELIASENWVSDAVMEAQGSIMTNKYAEGKLGLESKERWSITKTNNENIKIRAKIKKC